MARMAGRFAGILQLSVTPEAADDLAAALARLQDQGLRVVVERAEPESTTGGGPLYRIELVGNDRPGLVRDMSSILAERSINVEELATECSDAPMAGGLLLRVTAEVRGPADLSAEELRHALEARAPDFMVEVERVADSEPGAPS